MSPQAPQPSKNGAPRLDAALTAFGTMKPYPGSERPGVCETLCFCVCSAYQRAQAKAGGLVMIGTAMKLRAARLVASSERSVVREKLIATAKEERHEQHAHDAVARVR